MKILTANIAFGMPRMDTVAGNLRNHIAIHGPRILLHVFVPWTRGRKAGVAVHDPDYIRRHTDLRPVYDLIDAAKPDVIVLNEVLQEMHGEELTAYLRDRGFDNIAWGAGLHYPETHISTVVATKWDSTPIACEMPHLPCMGGGAGSAGMRVEDISMLGAHLGNGIPDLVESQLAYLAEVAAREEADGQKVMLAGDFNIPAHSKAAREAFRKLDLAAADGDNFPTCPTFLPFHTPLDHVFLPSTIRIKNLQTYFFGSDHLALSVETESAIGL
jgi:endonuclease/exonuclease/phosphatase family metal-dependent hydrolase